MSTHNIRFYGHSGDINEQKSANTHLICFSDCLPGVPKICGITLSVLPYHTPSLFSKSDRSLLPHAPPQPPHHHQILRIPCKTVGIQKRVFNILTCKSLRASVIMWIAICCGLNPTLKEYSM